MTQVTLSFRDVCVQRPSLLSTTEDSVLGYVRYAARVRHGPWEHVEWNNATFPFFPEWGAGLINGPGLCMSFPWWGFKGVGLRCGRVRFRIILEQGSNDEWWWCKDIKFRWERKKEKRGRCVCGDITHHELHFQHSCLRINAKRQTRKYLTVNSPSSPSAERFHSASFSFLRVSNKQFPLLYTFPELPEWAWHCVSLPGAISCFF